MRLNWFSPLPPAKTEIAHYTKRLLPYLRQKAEITLWTDQSEWDPELEDYSTVRQYRAEQPNRAEFNLADANIYHLGNNTPFHSMIWQTSRRHPGIVVLHDVRLHHLFAGAYQKLQDREGYLAAMVRHYGEHGQSDAKAFWEGRLSIDYMSEHYPLTCLALENALGAIVHTPQAFEQLKEQNQWSLGYAPLSYPASPRRKSNNDPVGTSSVGSPPYRLIVFGFLGPNRQLNVLLESLADFPQRAGFRLDIYGEITNQDRIRTKIRSLGLGGLATVHGFVPEEELNAALASAHMAINLRYPSMGEASMSQLRIWDNALPSLVTQTGWYASLSSEAVAFVRPGFEKEDIQAQLRAFLADPEQFALMGERGRAILERHHSSEAYVQVLTDLISATQLASWRALALSLADRAGSEMSAWIDGSELDDCYRRVAEGIHL